MKNWEEAGDDEIVCYCKNVNKSTIVSAIKSGNNTLKDIQVSTSACTGNNCKKMNPSGKCCSSDINLLLSVYGNVETNNSSCCSCSCK